MPVRPLFDLKADAAPIERGRTLSCVSCGLYKAALSPRMPPYGGNARGLMLVGEAPGAEEDRLGRPWQGKAGRALQRALNAEGLDLARDCVSLNSTNCRPPDDRTSTGHEVACCRARIVDPAVREHAPRVILLFGGSAVDSVLGPLCDDALGASISKWRGFAIPVPFLGAWVCPTYHPSYVLREERHPEVDTIWRQDVKRAVALLDAPVPEPDDLRARVTVLRGDDEILPAIYAAHDAELLSHDYETTGLRAFAHRIVCASFATSPDRAYAFMMPDSGPVRGAWAKLLSDPNVGKVSHNLKFENEWGLHHFDVDGGAIVWAWDSMQAAHVVDCRPGICGLKFQAFINFGVPAWNGTIDSYLKSVDDKDPRAPNRIEEFMATYGEDECLVYCGIDSLLAHRLAIQQMGIIVGG